MNAAFFLTIWALSTQSSPMGIIRVTVEGFNGREGRLVVYLFQEEAGIPPARDSIFAGSSCGIDGDSVIVSFLGVPHGEYALMAFQDLDGNGEPSESGLEPVGYLFPGPPAQGSTTGPPPSPPEGGMPASGGTGAPFSFDSISFLHRGDETSVTIMLHAGRAADMEGERPAGPPPGGRDFR
jgi:uncharacterized protein (DUF2141 family)